MISRLVIWCSGCRELAGVDIGEVGDELSLSLNRIKGLTSRRSKQLAVNEVR
jgi:hypothetical protein